jgi:transposase
MPSGGNPMAKRLEITDFALESAQAQITDLSDAREFRRNIIVVLAADGRYNASEIANMLKIGVRTVFDAIKKVSEPEKRPVGEWGGHRSSYLTPDEESAFLDDFEEKALEGTILTVPELHKAFMVKTGKKVPPSTIYRLLKRNGWRKVKPDTRHPKADTKGQEKFNKKHSKFNWRKLV